MLREKLILKPFHLNCRAQASLELLVITLVVFSLATGIIMLYMSMRQQTDAMQLAKIELLNLVNEREQPVFIKSFDARVTTEYGGKGIIFEVSTTPVLTRADLDIEFRRSVIDPIESDLREKTNYDFVCINLNCPDTICCPIP